MPVILADPRTRDHRPDTDGRALEIGLLNSLGDAGLDGGERQFTDLLAKAAGPRLIRLHLFSMPEIVRGPGARARIERLYTPFSRLSDTPLDGLILTGCEPRASRLQDEPYWPRLTGIIDWAHTHLRSTAFSCLAAHAAVLHLDGIRRRPLPQKLSGVFPVREAQPHPLLTDIESPLEVSHSRYNDLDERDLVDAGYEILTRSAATGVDAFVKPGRNLLLFLQGHPEYDADTLYREYRRDVLRFLDGTSDVYPSIPANYVTRNLEMSLNAFASQARLERDPSLFAAFPHGSRRAAPWNDTLAVALFANWLTHLEARVPEHAA